MSIDTIKKEDKEYIITLIKEDKRKEARQIIGRLLGVKKTQQNYWLNKLSESTKIEEVEIANEIVSNKELDFKDGYVFNKEQDKYIFLCKKVGRNVVLEGSLVKAILAAYSNFNGDGSSINEISRKFNIPRNVISEILTILNFTHDELPVLKEEYAEKSEEEIVDDLIQRKKFEAYQKFQKRDWKETQDAANKWHQLQIGQLNPIKDFINTFSFTREDVVIPEVKKTGDYDLIIGLSDLHFGGFADGDELYLGSDWNIDKTAQAVELIAFKIKKALASRTYQFKSLKLLLLGDLLDSLTGETEKGTELETHPIGEKQFDVAFKTLEKFISTIYSIFPNIEVIGVAGNHSYYGDWALMKCLEKFYSNNKNIKFNVSRKKWVDFKIGNSLFIAEHGYSAFYKARVPDDDKGRDAYVKNLLMSKPENLVGTKHRYFLTADKHTLEYKEYNGFEFFRFSTIVGGNRFVDHLNLKNSPRQNALIVGEDGVEEIVNFYL